MWPAPKHRSEEGTALLLAICFQALNNAHAHISNAHAYIPVLVTLSFCCCVLFRPSEVCRTTAFFFTFLSICLFIGRSLPNAFLAAVRTLFVLSLTQRPCVAVRFY